MMIGSKMMCLASNPKPQDLRFQLDQLHREASETAAKANNARLRLLRLSEAAEKLRKQAAKSIQLGKDNDARELLMQKNKVLQAMEKSKSRALLLDELAAKLNEAISAKETLLIGKVASNLEVDQGNVSQPVHIILPVQDTVGIVDENDKSCSDKRDACVEEDLQMDSKIECEIRIGEKTGNISVSNSIKPWIEIPSRLEGISSYNSFLEHLDSQLSGIEEDLTAYLKLLNMVLEDKEMTTNVKMQQTIEILHKVSDARRREFCEENRETLVIERGMLDLYARVHGPVSCEGGPELVQALCKESY